MGRRGTWWLRQRCVSIREAADEDVIFVFEENHAKGDCVKRRKDKRARRGSLSSRKTEIAVWHGLTNELLYLHTQSTTSMAQAL